MKSNRTAIRGLQVTLQNIRRIEADLDAERGHEGYSTIEDVVTRLVTELGHRQVLAQYDPEEQASDRVWEQKQANAEARSRAWADPE